MSADGWLGLICLAGLILFITAGIIGSKKASPESDNQYWEDL